MKKHIKGLMVCGSLGVALLLAGPAWSAVATDTQPTTPAATQPIADMTLEQLDEVVLTGKRLEQRVQEAEQRFYKRYNQVNDKQDLAVICDYRWVDRNAPVRGLADIKRSCVPRFFLAVAGTQVAYSYPSAVPGCDVQYSGGFMSRNTGQAGSGFPGFVEFSPFFDHSYCSSGGTPAPIVRSPAVMPTLLWLDRRAEFVAHLRQVLNSDPQLQAMAGELNALTEEGKESRRLVAEAVKLRLATLKCARPISPRIVTVCGD